jgi:hypothetical protein
MRERECVWSGPNRQSLASALRERGCWSGRLTARGASHLSPILECRCWCRRLTGGICHRDWTALHWQGRDERGMERAACVWEGRDVLRSQS